MKKKTFILLFIFMNFNWANAQNVDSLFTLARQEAFEKKDYRKAIELCKAIEKNSFEVELFLGRVYTWVDSVSLARIQFIKLLQHDSLNIEVAKAYIDLEYWHNNYTEALQLCEQFLVFYPKNDFFLLKKIKILIKLNKYLEAKLLIKGLSISPETKFLRAKIDTNLFKSKLSFSYDYWHFHKRYQETSNQQPWHIRTLTYSHTTNYGTFLIRWQNATRFGNTGNQIEIEAYPQIKKGLNGYINWGLSKQYPVFPNYRLGTSLYANLLKGYEIEAGFRLLRFQSKVWIYTAALGKYMGNYFFNLRTYLVPNSHSLSPSFRLTTNYYFAKSNDYFSCYVGKGFYTISDLYLFNSAHVDSSNAGILFSKNIHNIHILKTNFSIIKQAQYSGIQATLEVSYSVLF